MIPRLGTKQTNRSSRALSAVWEKKRTWRGIRPKYGFDPHFGGPLGRNCIARAQRLHENHQFIRPAYYRRKSNGVRLETDSHCQRSTHHALSRCVEVQRGHFRNSETEEAEMKLSIALSALLIAGFVAVSPKRASAVVYCQYIEHPAGCVVRPGVAVAPTHDVRKIPPSIDGRTSGFILRQDLFDRNNPNNLRSDYHGPPAQPGQF
jgi:hypothetical protein